MTRWIVLLRAVNVGKRQLPMAELRMLAGGLGFEDARTYVASGNLIVSAPGPAEAVATAIEQAIADRFGFASEAIVRNAAQWARYASASPFPDAEAKFLHLILSRQPPAADAVERLTAAASGSERIAAKGDAIWIDYAGGVARSKLTPKLIDRALGSPATGRNWNSVCKIAEMVREA